MISPSSNFLILLKRSIIFVYRAEKGQALQFLREKFIALQIW
jgi:hypothetical protein